MPAEDEKVVTVPGQSQAPGQVTPSSAPDAAGIDAGQGPPVGAERAMVWHGGAPGFSRQEREEEEVWKAQYEVGSQIQAALELALRLHKTSDFEISRVSALPQDLSTLDPICVSSAYNLHPQRLRQISRDKSTELAQQYSEVQWLERQNATLIVLSP